MQSVSFVVGNGAQTVELTRIMRLLAQHGNFTTKVGFAHFVRVLRTYTGSDTPTTMVPRAC